MFQLVDLDSLLKTRRSLLITATATLIFANLKITSNNLSISGVIIKISQENIILLGQAGTLYLLFVFLLQAFPEFLKFFDQVWDFRISAKERREWGDFQDHWNLSDEDYDDDYGPGAESAQIKEKFAGLRRKKNAQINSLSFISYSITNFIVSYVSPVALALVCLIWPETLNFFTGNT